MPGFDGTGPRGMGPMTGGGRGFCAIPLPSPRPAYAGTGFHMPYPYGAPWGMPYRGSPPFVPQITQEEELDYLKGLAQSVRDNLKDIEMRIQQIDSKEE